MNNSERLAALEINVQNMKDKMKESHDTMSRFAQETGDSLKEMQATIKRIDLNGHGPDIKAVAQMRPALESIAKALTEDRLRIIVSGADVKADTEGFWKTVKRVTHTDGPWAKIIVGAVLSSAALGEIVRMIAIGHP